MFIRGTCWIVLVFCLLCGLSADAATDFTRVKFTFASADEAGRFMSTADDFARAITPMTLSLLHETPETYPLADHLRFLGQQTLDWTPNETASIQKDIETLIKAVTELDLTLSLPPEILLIKTTGDDEFHSYYTRGQAIIFPVNGDSHSVTSDAPTFFHEMFHILSRHHLSMPDANAFHDRLYRICGFERVAEQPWPASLADRALTNPDAFHVEHAVEVTAQGAAVRVVPFFFSAIAQKDVHGPIDEAKTFKLGLIDTTTLVAGAPRMFTTAETDYVKRVRANSHYTIHPEEIMAENFRLLLMQQAGLPASIKYPDALIELRAALTAF